MGYFDSLAKPSNANLASPVSTAPPSGTLHPYAAKAIGYELGRLDALARPWHEGAGWDTTTYEVACNLLEFANSPWSGYTRWNAERDLRAHAPSDHKWGPREHDQKWESAMMKVGLGGRAEPAQGELPALPEVTTFETPLASPIAVAAAAAEAGEESDPEAVGRAIEAMLPRLDWDTLFASQEEEEWILEPILPARRNIAIYSPPKAGKSLLLLEAAVAIARGTEFLGYEVEAPRRVLYVDWENDPRGDIRTRLEAMNVGPADLENLCYLSFPRLSKLDTVQGGQELVMAAKHYGCEVVIIDTISRAVGGEENANDTWLGFYKHTGMLLKGAGIACLRLDHSGKDETKGMRGGSAKYGDVDAVWSMKKVSEETFELECTANRLPIFEKSLILHREEEPNLHHRVDARGQVAKWEARDDEAIRVLDAEFGKASVGVNKAQLYLQSVGCGRGRTALGERILPKRDRQNNVVVLQEDSE